MKWKNTSEVERHQQDANYPKRDPLEHVKDKRGKHDRKRDPHSEPCGINPRDESVHACFDKSSLKLPGSLSRRSGFARAHHNDGLERRHNTRTVAHGDTQPDNAAGRI